MQGGLGLPSPIFKACLSDCTTCRYVRTSLSDQAVLDWSPHFQHPPPPPPRRRYLAEAADSLIVAWATRHDRGGSRQRTKRELPCRTCAAAACAF